MSDDVIEGTHYHLVGPLASGRGHLDGTAFVVSAGARARGAEVPSTDGATRRLRQQLVADGTLVGDGDSLALTREHRFSSPSQAAAVLLGRTANGWVEWKDGAGRTLKAAMSSAMDQEVEFRRRWYQAHCKRFDADAAAVADMEVKQRGFAASAAEALGLVDTLTRSRDLDAFRAGMQLWAVKPDTLAFNGPGGQMLVNQLAKHTDEPAMVAATLADSMSVPTDDAEAAAKIESLAAYVESIRVGAHPAPGRVPFLLSYLWSLADRSWPVMWSSAVSFIDFTTGEQLPADPAPRYGRYAELVREIDDDVDRFERWPRGGRPPSRCSSTRCSSTVAPTGSTRRRST